LLLIVAALFLIRPADPGASEEVGTRAEAADPGLGEKSVLIADLAVR